VAQSPTIYNFDVELSHVDRGVYQSLALRVACQPSETPEFLLTRVLAYCLEYQEGISFGKGFTEPGEPALAVRDLTGALRVWIDIGSPDPARLHKASLTVPRVVVYSHKEPRVLLAALGGERIHRAEELEVYCFDRGMLEGLVGRLERRTKMGVSVSDGHMYVTVGDGAWDGAIERQVLAGG
jgi:uncharacterized protein YaeQ